VLILILNDMRKLNCNLAQVLEMEYNLLVYFQWDCVWKQEMIGCFDKLCIFGLGEQGFGEQGLGY